MIGPLLPSTARIRPLSAADFRQGVGEEQGKRLTGKRNGAARRHPSSRDAAPSAGGVEFGSPVGLILGFEWPGWRRRWPRLGDLGGQTEVSQDALHHRRLLDQRDEPPVAAGKARTSSPNVRGINSAPDRHPPGMGWRHSWPRRPRPFARLLRLRHRHRVTSPEHARRATRRVGPTCRAPTAAIRDALSPGAASQEPEHDPQRDGATARDPRRAGTAADAAGSRPTVGPAHPAARHGPDAPIARPCGGRRTGARSVSE